MRKEINRVMYREAVPIIVALVPYGAVAVSMVCPAMRVTPAFKLTLFVTCLGGTLPVLAWLLFRLFRKGMKIANR